LSAKTEGPLFEGRISTLDRVWGFSRPRSRRLSQTQQRPDCSGRCHETPLKAPRENKDVNRATSNTRSARVTTSSSSSSSWSALWWLTWPWH